MQLPIQIAGLLGRKELLLGAFFFAFFAFAAVAIRYSDRRWLRRGYLAYFFLFLLLVNLTGMPMFPFVSWYKFSEPLPETISRYEIRVADATGDELVYDARATPPMNGPHLWTVGERMATAYDRRTTCRTARFFLSRARTYRKHVQRESLDAVEYVDFPRHVLDRQWRGDELASHSRFTALRVYRVTFETAPSGRSVESSRERLVLAVRGDGTMVRRHGATDAGTNESARTVGNCGEMTAGDPSAAVQPDGRAAAPESTGTTAPSAPIVAPPHP